MSWQKCEKCEDFEDLGESAGWMSDKSDMFPAVSVLYAAPGPPKTFWTQKELAELDELAEM